MQFAGADEQQRHLQLAFGAHRCTAGQQAEVVHGVLVAAVAVGRLPAAALRVQQFLARDAADAAHGGDRHGEGRLADADEHGLGHGERLRQAQGEGGALARARADVERTTELADFTGHHVHADAAAGEPVDLGRGREAGLQDQRVELGVGQHRVRPQQPALLAAAADRGAVQPGAVVRDLDHHFRAFAAHGHRDGALVRLAGTLAQCGRLDAVGDGVAQHVLERRGHALQDVAVQFPLGAIQAQLDLLAGFRGGLAHHPPQARQQGIEGHHAGAHQAFLQLRADPGLLRQQRFVLAGQVVQGALQAVHVGR